MHSLVFISCAGACLYAVGVIQAHAYMREGKEWQREKVCKVTGGHALIWARDHYTCHYVCVVGLGVLAR
jgi:hypothetical protein